ncbi:MAG: response regulator transcription factor [Lewinellaceae bacterium]|jgi:DNA-binding NarL/FixJ family response regulator|nr:response regulator transcription factor [Lewinellaceae bacterium]
MYKIGIIEDNPATLAGLERTINAYPDLNCLVAAPSAADFWAQLPERTVLDIIFIDIDLPGTSGLDILPALRKRFPDAELVMYTQSENGQDILKALTLGATGYLLKEVPSSQIRQHIDTILEGGAAISGKMARKVIEYLNPPRPSVNTPKLLSEKEEQVLRLIAEGNSYEECAALMGLSVNGVKYHIKNIYRKLNVSNRIEAITLWKNKTL